MAGQKTTIYSADYNSIQSKIAQVLGFGSDDFGYGQTLSSSQLLPRTVITKTNWNDLRTDLLKARQHQTGADESGSLTLITTGIQVSEAIRLAYDNLANTITTNRLIKPPVSQASKDVLVSEQYNQAWNGYLTHTTTINFASADNARYFFNSGSSLYISATRTGGTSGSKNSTWTTLLANMGEISISRSSSATTGTGTIYNAVGWSTLTSTNTLIFSKTTDSVTYTPSQYNLYARLGSSSAQVILTMEFADLSGQPNAPWGVDENVDGILTSTVGNYRSSGGNVSVLAPTIISSIAGGTTVPTYSVTSPNVTSINEGGTVTFTVNTSGVPNGTTYYWTTSGTVAANRFSDNVLSGSFTISSNTGTIARTVTNDYFTDGSTAFGLQVRATSISGPILSVSPDVTVNDTSQELIAVSAGSVNEGGSVTFTITTTNTPSATWYWSTNAGSGLTAADFTDNSLTGSVNITSNSGTITRTLVNDFITEGSETFNIQLHSGSPSGPVKVSSASVTINDTSKAVYSISPNVGFIREGSSVSYSITTTGVSNATTVYYSVITISGTITAGTFTDGIINGSFVVSANASNPPNGLASLVKTATNDGVSQGSRKFAIQMYSDSGRTIPVGSLSNTVEIWDINQII